MSKIKVNNSLAMVTTLIILYIIKFLKKLKNGTVYIDQDSQGKKILEYAINSNIQNNLLTYD